MLVRGASDPTLKANKHSRLCHLLLSASLIEESLLRLAMEFPD
jgi:hypothetical protein